MGRKKSPYAQIDWEKAAAFFQQSIPSSETSSFPSTKELLGLLAQVGAVGMIFMFPGVARGLKSLQIGQNSYRPWKVKKVLNQLERQKYISVTEDKKGAVTVKITQQGTLRALTYHLDALALQKPKKWDRKWRVVIFDIPEDHKKLRDIFRIRLKQLGLYQLQESVFVSPYRCFDEIEFLRELYGVPFHVRYLIAEKIEDDEHILQYYGLS